MSIVIGVWFALAGGLAVLAGLSAMRRARRLRSSGLSAWAMIVASPAAPDQPPHGSARRMLVQFALANGQVIERNVIQSARKAAALRPGQKVLVWYDPADPMDVLVYGRDGRRADRAFVAAGMLFILTGAAIAAFSH